MLVDTHAHVNFRAFAADRGAVLARAREAGVAVVNVGTHLGTSRSAVALARENPGLAYAVVGLHPVHTYEQDLEEEGDAFRTHGDVFDAGAFRELAGDPSVVGIGECGLDYYRLPEDEDPAPIKQRQREAFAAQIRLAKELNKALVIHCRPSKGTQDAYEDILKILDGEGTERLRFEAHSFTGTAETANAFVSRGAYIGINGIVTFDKTGEMERVVKAVPLERIVLETDCPYLAPVPFRGKRNEPRYVMSVAQKLAELKGVSGAEVAEATNRSAAKLFGVLLGVDL